MIFEHHFEKRVAGVCCGADGLRKGRVEDVVDRALCARENVRAEGFRRLKAGIVGAVGVIVEVVFPARLLFPHVGLFAVDHQAGGQHVAVSGGVVGVFKAPLGVERTHGPRGCIPPCTSCFRISMVRASYGMSRSKSPYNGAP